MNTVMTGNIVLLAIVAVFVVAGLAVSLIAITLASIKEVNGRTPQWPVSWPEPPMTLSRQRVDVASGQADLPSRRVPLPPRADAPTPRVSLPQEAEVPRQRAAPPQPVDVPPQRVTPRS
ncbi:hypothetical protein ACSDR0_04375 [Streptosporangium sp. G11]